MRVGLLAGPQAPYICAWALANVSRSLLHENTLLLVLDFRYSPFMSVTALKLARRSRSWPGFSMGHMEALPYNHALCESNVGNQAMSLPKCASPGRQSPRTKLLHPHLAKQSLLPSLGLTLRQATAVSRRWHSLALDRVLKAAPGLSFPPRSQADSRS